jgi:hypothetical protein
MQSKFEFDEWFKNYNFLNFEIACMHVPMRREKGG